MKIGIMGGTFNPIHNGHLMLGEYAYRNFALDEIWFMPNGNPPHKDNPSLLDNTDERSDMVNLAIKDILYFKFCDYEMKRSGKSYSYETMENFQKLYPEHHFYFIIGADSLFNIEKWKCPERLLKVVTILAAFRDDVDTLEEMNAQIEYLNEKYDSDIRLLQTPILPISSHEIREKISTGSYQKIDELHLPEAVAAYILEKNLYQEDSLYE